MLDVIVVGAGPNGIVCASELAKSGARVVLLEAGTEPGGMLGTHEFYPEFHAPLCVGHWPDHNGSPFDELRLERHGLVFATNDTPTFGLTNERIVRLDRGEATQSFNAAVGRYSAALQRLVSSAPPVSKDGRQIKRSDAARILFALRRAGREDFRELLRLIGTNVFDWSEEWFDDEDYRAAISLDAVMGHFAGPRSPGTVLSFLLRRLLGKANRQPRYRQVAPALRAALQAQGVHLRTATTVQRILVESGRVTGVVLNSGDILRALHVVSTVDPKTTVFGMTGPQHFETGFVKKLQHVRANGCVARLTLALRDVPVFSGCQAEQLGGRLLLSGDRHALELAFDAAKYRQFSKQPALEVTIPTINDPELAPAGQHILCANAIYAPANLDGGWDQHAREDFLAAALRVLAQYAPGIEAQIIAAELMTPIDLEQRFGVAGGHWHHGELAADQFWAMRPVPGAARYRLPIGGLYLGGAGTHPGGGVSGWSGSLAAAALLEDAV